MTDIDNNSVLIVDKDPSAIKVLQAMLASRGFQVGVAAKGADAEGMMKDHAYDIIITDFDLPDVDGYKLLNTVKAFYRDFKVMVMSEDEEKRELLMQRGLLKMFGKPLSLDEFIDELSIFIRERRKSRRFNVKVKLHCQMRFKDGAETVQGELMNVSIDGALVRSKENIAKYAKIVLEISLSKDFRVVYKVNGAVVRSFHDADDYYFNAIYFDDDRELTILEQLKPFIRFEEEE